MTPSITVLMGVHNGEEFLAQTLASVAAQIHEDYEFLIVDDASSDGSPAMLAQAASRDPRIRILTNTNNIGLTKSLNRGLGAARGEFIARIDADDVCLPQRLSVQLANMRANPDHAGVTSGFAMIDAAGREVRHVTEPLDDWQVRWLLGRNPPAPHPTFFFKRCPDGTNPILYDERYRTAQDFDLWGRLAEHGPTSRLPDALVQYRRHDGAITHAKRYEQAQNCAAIGTGHLKARLPVDVVRVLAPLVEMFAYNAPPTGEAIKAAVAGADALMAHDRAEAGKHGPWARRMIAGLLADAFLSRAGGLGKPASVAAFLWHARGYLPALGSAVLSDPGTAMKSLGNRKRG